MFSLATSSTPCGRVCRLVRPLLHRCTWRIYTCVSVCVSDVGCSEGLQVVCFFVLLTLALLLVSICALAGVAQQGKSFRNEIRVSNFVFRSREFEQWELQYFCHPDSSATWHDYWVDFSHKWLLSLGLQPDNVRRNVYKGAVRGSSSCQRLTALML